MTSVPGTNDQVSAGIAAEKLWQVAGELFRESGLMICYMPNGIDIYNPKDTDKGQVHISGIDGFVSWERPEWEFWGVLRPLAGEGEEVEDIVDAQKIIDTLS